MFFVFNLLCLVVVFIGIMLFVLLLMDISCGSNNKFAKQQVCGFNYEAYKNDIINGIDGDIRLKRRMEGYYNMC